jgi:hypothetical protein
MLREKKVHVERSQTLQQKKIRPCQEKYFRLKAVSGGGTGHLQTILIAFVNPHILWVLEELCRNISVIFFPDLCPF